MSDLHTLRVRIEGKVQGVWYRGWTVEQARARSLSGWVRNLFDGSVEALFSGPRPAVEDMVEACRQGPPAARVDRIEASPDDAPEHTGFFQRHSI